MNQLYLRRATSLDLDDLYEIWMQDHVLPFMTFEKQSKRSFKPIFEALMKESEIYVIEINGKAIATRRIIYQTGHYAHSVELASFGVHKDHLKKGYGTRLYRYLIEKIRKERPDIKRVLIRQETNNKIALALAQKMEFEIEAVFPSWSSRTMTGKKKIAGENASTYYIGSRFLVLMLDKQRKIVSRKLVKPFHTQIPAFNVAQNRTQQATRVELSSDHTQAICYSDQEQLGMCRITHGVRTYAHIQFWSIQLNDKINTSAMQACLRQLIGMMKSTAKKIVIYTHDSATQMILQNLGFNCRGKRVASFQNDGVYYDEIACDFGLFNIEDAKGLLLHASVGSDYDYSAEKTAILSVLDVYQDCLKKAMQVHQIDMFDCIYLQNCTFDIVSEHILTSLIEE